MTSYTSLPQYTNISATFGELAYHVNLSLRDPMKGGARSGQHALYLPYTSHWNTSSSILDSDDGGLF